MSDLAASNGRSASTRNFRAIHSLQEKARAMAAFSTPDTHTGQASAAAAPGTSTRTSTTETAAAHVHSPQSGRGPARSRSRSPADDDRPDNSKKQRTEKSSDIPPDLVSRVAVQSSLKKSSPSKRTAQFAYAPQDTNESWQDANAATSPGLVSPPTSVPVPASSPATPALVAAPASVHVPAVGAQSHVVPSAPPPLSPSDAAHMVAERARAVTMKSSIIEPDPASVFVTRKDMAAAIAPLEKSIGSIQSSMAEMLGKMSAWFNQSTVLPAMPPYHAAPSSTPIRSDSPSASSVDSASLSRTPSSHDHRLVRTLLPPFNAVASPHASAPASAFSFSSSPPARFSAIPTTSSSSMMLDSDSLSSSPTSSASTISSFSHKQPSNKLRDQYAAWHKAPQSSALGVALELLVAQAWDRSAADSEKAAWLNFGTTVTDAATNKLFVNEVVASIGELADIPAGFIKHAVQEKWRSVKQSRVYGALQDQTKANKLSIARRRERRKKRRESRAKALAQTHMEFTAANGYAAENTIPGPEANYLDMKRVVDCEDMHSDCESEKEMVNGALRSVIYKRGMPHRSQLCESFLRLLDKRSRKHACTVGTDPEKASKALERYRGVNVQLLVSSGIPPRMLNGVVPVLPDAAAVVSEDAISQAPSALSPAAPPAGVSVSAVTAPAAPAPAPLAPRAKGGAAKPASTSTSTPTSASTSTSTSTSTSRSTSSTSTSTSTSTSRSTSSTSASGSAGAPVRSRAPTAPQRQPQRRSNPKSAEHNTNLIC